LHESSRKFQNLLLEYDGDEGDEVLKSEIDFEDLVDIEIDPKLSSNYLTLNADHMKKISAPLIKLGIALQALALLFIVMSDAFLHLVHFRKKDQTSRQSSFRITAWNVYIDNKKYNYWDFYFDPDLCTSLTIENKIFCRALDKAWTTNTILNISLIIGVLLVIRSLLWTYW
jgi:hypothetical protein